MAAGRLDGLHLRQSSLALVGGPPGTGYRPLSGRIPGRVRCDRGGGGGDRPAAEGRHQADPARRRRPPARRYPGPGPRAVPVQCPVAAGRFHGAAGRTGLAAVAAAARAAAGRGLDAGPAAATGRTVAAGPATGRPVACAAALAPGRECPIYTAGVGQADGDRR
ncbi:hypothetical protein G6F68_016918 [Rhizopus microsporus]|nr:hypothetical protein G6F68_016918 [Rhizopus microsporus]